jgi:hypothetical protein
MMKTGSKNLQGFKNLEGLALGASLLLMAHTAIAGVNDGLLAYYPFNSHVKDMSGNGFNGTEHGELKYVLGQYAKAVQLDGKNDSISLSVPLDGSADWTVCTWLKIDKIDPKHSDWQNIISNHEEGVVLGFSNENARLAIYDSQNIQLIASEYGAISVGTMTFACFIRAENTLSLYKNGIKVGENQNGQNVLFSTFKNMGMWRPNSASLLDREPLFGLLDDLRIYQRALSAHEIQALYQGDICEQHAVFSADKGKLTIPLLEMPLLEPTSYTPTGKVRIFESELSVTQPVLANLKVVPDRLTFLFSKPTDMRCHAIYSQQRRTLTIPYLDIGSDVYRMTLQHLQNVPLDLGVLHMKHYKWLYSR